MRALDRKLLRDAAAMRGQLAAIGLVMACGVVTFVMSLSTLVSLERTQAAYYERYRFADVFDHLERAPLALASRVREIPGVTAVDARIVAEVNLDVPGLAEPAAGRIVSLPDLGPPALDRLHLRRGRLPEPGRAGEVVASEAFAEAHRMEPGAEVTAVLHGRRERLRIVGVALSPEFVYQIRAGAWLPDDLRFGVFWMLYHEMAPAFDMDGAFNDLCVSLAPQASEPEVIERLDALTEPYGGLGAYGRADQLSHRFVADEIRELRGMALIPPAIFLTVAAFLLRVVLGRLVGTQREQIAALKAFGYSNGQVGLHYVKLVLLLVLLGSAAGTAGGAWLGWDMTRLYSRFFRFPLFAYALPPWVVVVAVGVTGFASVAGAVGAVRRAVRLPPAEAMRPEPPAVFRPTVLERLGLGRLLWPSARMVLRHLERTPARSVLAGLGIALAVAVMVLGSFVEDTVDFVVDHQFHRTQRQDVALQTVEPTTLAVVDEMRHLPGVLRVEPSRAVGCRLRFGHRSRRVAILGLVRGGDLFRPLDASGVPVEPPADGLLLSEALAERLEVRVGEAVTVEVLEGERPVRDVPVAGVVRDFAGLAAYMDLGAVARLLREQGTLNGAFLAVDPTRSADLYAALKETPRIASVSVKAAALQSFRDTVAESLLRMRAFNVLFACVIACGVVYSGARIALSERARDLATLRVLGFRRGEVSAMLLGETAVLTVLAVPVGLALGHGFSWLATLALETESHRFPLVIRPSTYALGATVTLVAATLSSLVVRRRLDRLDLVAVLKAKE